MLKGTLIELGPDKYGFENISFTMSKPEVIRLVWPIINIGPANGNLRYANTREAIGKEAILRDGRVGVYVGQGAYIRGVLENGPNTKAAIVEVTTVEKPKVRAGVEVRWHHDGYRGFWQKYLKRTGWVQA